jgi:hypothetical protein
MNYLTAPSSFLINEPGRTPELWPQSVSKFVLKLISNMGCVLSEKTEWRLSHILQNKKTTLTFYVINFV